MDGLSIDVMNRLVADVLAGRSASVRSKAGRKFYASVKRDIAAAPAGSVVSVGSEVRVDAPDDAAYLSQAEKAFADEGVAVLKKSLQDDLWLKNCGIGSTGFLPGNQCAAGGTGGAGGAVVTSANAPSVGGAFPKTTVVDSSKWPQSNSAAKWAAKKIAHMEDLFAKGGIGALQAMDTFPKSAKPNPYQKAVHEAHGKIMAKHAENVPKPPANTTPVSPEKKAEVAASPAAEKSGLKKLPGGVIDGTTWKKTGEQLGSNPGGTYTDKSGGKWYVKTPEDVNHSKSEVTASKLYALAGADATKAEPVLVMGTDKGYKLGVATQWQSLAGIDAGSKEHRQLVQKDFAVHAWLANWDAAGATFDNQKISGSGGVMKAVTVDVGGSLTFRAQGKPKPFEDDAKEWNTMRDPKVNPQAAALFAEMTPAQLHASAQKLASIKEADVRAIVEKHYIGGSDKMVATLMARRDAILKQAGMVNNTEAAKVQAKQSETPVASVSSAIAKALPKPEVPKPVSVEVPQAVAQPKSTTAMGVPPPPVVHSAANPTANAKLQQIWEAAKTGNVAAVEAVATNATSQNTYSKKAHQYKQQVLAAMGSGGKADASAAAPVTAGKPKATAAEPKAAPKVTVNPAKLPDVPTFQSSNVANVTANTNAAQKAIEFAKAGDLDGLKGMTLPPSPKLAAWHSDLVNNVSNQLNPPPPPKPISGTIKEIHEKAGVIKGTAGVDKVGKWLVAASMDDKSKVPDAQPLNFKQANWDDGYQAWSKLPSGVKSHVKNYTGGSYGDMNDSLRSGSPSVSALAAANGVTKAAMPLAAGTTLSRKHNLEGEDLQKLKESVGKVVQDKAILSTSTDPHVWHGNVHWKLAVSPGVQGLPAMNFSKHSSEYEVLLPPNTRVLVTKVEDSGYGGITVAHGILLPFHPDQCCPP